MSDAAEIRDRVAERGGKPSPRLPRLPRSERPAACVCGQRDAERYPDATDRVIVPSAADCPVHGTPAAASTDPYQIDSLTREEAELMAAKLFKALATQAIRDAARGRRNMATATREASQLNHLAIRLEGFADGR